MRDKGALEMQKEGQFVYYTVADDRFLDAARLIREALGDVIRRKAQSVEMSAVSRNPSNDSSP